MALSERDRAILDFERIWWTEPGPKELAIRTRFDLSPTRYYQVLGEPARVGRGRRLRPAGGAPPPPTEGSPPAGPLRGPLGRRAAGPVRPGSHAADDGSFGRSAGDARRQGGRPGRGRGHHRCRPAPSQRRHPQRGRRRRIVDHPQAEHRRPPSRRRPWPSRRRPPKRCGRRRRSRCSSPTAPARADWRPSTAPPCTAPDTTPWLRPIPDGRGADDRRSTTPRRSNPRRSRWPRVSASRAAPSSPCRRSCRSPASTAPTSLS